MINLIKSNNVRLSILLWLCIFASCSQLTKPTTGLEDNVRAVFKKYLVAKVFTLDPLKSYEVATTNVVNQLYDSLFEFNEELEAEPYLVKNYSYNQTDNTYFFELKKNIYFTNGKELTSDDVVFTFNRFCKHSRSDWKISEIIPGCSSLKKNAGADFGVKKIDRYKFSIALQSHYPPFITNIASHSFSIIPNDFAGLNEDDFWKNPVATGAYILDTFEDDLIILKSNKNYFNGEPDIKVIEYHAMPEENVESKIISNQLDDYWPYRYHGKLSSNYVPYTARFAAVCFVGFNLQKKPYNNIWFRRAIASVVDKDSILKAIGHENYEGTLKATGFVPYGVLGYISGNDSKIDAGDLKYNLKKAGYDDISSVPPIKIVTTKPLWSSVVINEIKKQLQKAGFKVIISEYTISEFVEKINKEGPSDVVVLRLMLNQPETYHLLEYFKSDYVFNLFNNKNHGFDSILEESQKESDRKKRAELYGKANQMINENLWSINLFHEVSRVSYVNKRFVMPPINYLGVEFLKIRKIKINDI